MFRSFVVLQYLHAYFVRAFLRAVMPHVVTPLVLYIENLFSLGCDGAMSQPEDSFRLIWSW